MTTLPRPQREKKGDRLLHPDATRDEIACDYAISPFDEVAREMDAKWGIDRLPCLAPPDMARKYGAVLALMNEAIANRNPQACADLAANCIKGMRAMDAAAIASGAKPATGDLVEYDLDGWKIGILLDERQWPAAKERRPDLHIVTLRECALALEFRKNEIVREAEKHFPGAQVVAMRPRPQTYDDSIPF